MKNKGWRVTLAGTGINLALGVLYTWSIFKKEISESIQQGGVFSWDLSSINDPYAVACLTFALTMVVAGKCQDRFGPRVTAILGGLLVGAGFLIISQTADYWGWIIGFGVLAGAGIGFGYSSATPPALRWFPSAKTGLIAGIVVSGFGLAPVYIAPLASYLTGELGLQTTMMILGVGFTVVVCSLAMLLSNPPEHYSVNEPAASQATAARELLPSELLKESKFYILWTIYFIGAGAGLMVIGSVAGMAKQSMGAMAFMAVVIMAVGNAGGRVVAGVLSDRIGRINTLFAMLIFQAVLMFSAIPLLGGNDASAVALIVLATFIGFNYGTNLSLFPAFAKGLWGAKNFGTNYGMLFTAWGVGAFVLVRVAEVLKASSGSFTSSFAVAGGLLVFSALLTFMLREKKETADLSLAHAA
ncbi:L-lactate MFS transporter [Alkalimarinus alittae]|uniref:OFA family MFS transporter n=1 Tax=Alkalimarinus alittae TaxID=2961619 RepID=A0ABY6N4J4_9ALTE|nr:OFA family MFS transporter [Alkalimarinus alittae]UZE97047.1 OFA family MFS transporter [Alkalimarinus alittae]